MAALSVSLVALLVAMPPAAALAESPAAPSTTSLPAPPVLELTTAQLGPILSNLPIADLGMTEAQLGKVISGLNPGLGSEVTQLTGVVSTLLSKNSAANLGELVSSLSGQTGLLGTLLKTLLPSLTPSQVVEALSPSQLEEFLANLSGGNPTGALGVEGISKLLSGLSGKLDAEQLAALTGILGGLTASLSGSGLSKFQESVRTLLSGLSKGELSTVLNALEPTLIGTGLTQLEALLGKLGTLTPTELSKELQTLLGGLSSAQLSTLLGDLFGTAGGSSLQPLLNELLSGLSLSPTTVEGLAGQLGISVKTLAEDLGTTTTSLPVLAATLAGPEGSVLSLLSKLGGLSLTLLNHEGKEGGSEKEGSSGKEAGVEGGKGGEGGKTGETGEKTSNEAGNGGSNSSGGNGQSSPAGSGGATTLVVNLPPADTAQTAAKAVNVPKPAKIKILSRRVSRGVATIVAQVPAAGRVTLSGRGVSSETRKAARAERITLRVKLSKAGSASLRKHRRRLKVTLTASFKATVGSASSVRTTVVFT
jgi:hypothetical protein